MSIKVKTQKNHAKDTKKLSKCARVHYVFKNIVYNKSDMDADCFAYGEIALCMMILE